VRRCGIVEVNGKCLSINSSASSGVELLMLEVAVKIINVINVVVVGLVMNLNAFKASKEHDIVVIKVIILDVRLEALL
jgi:hypothetical protein